ncbi:9221_t:CDS:2, partial [Cetraspora pellucida]
MKFDSILNKNTASCVSVPMEFSKEYELNHINISVCEEPKSNTEVAVADVIDKNSKEIQYCVYQIITDGNIKCAQKIKVANRSTSNLIHHLSSVHKIMDNQINNAKTHPKPKNDFLTRSLLKFIICENMPLNLQGFLGIICSWIDDSFKIHEVLLTLTYLKYPHTAINIYNAINQQIDYWELTGKIFTITSDNRANVKAVINKIEGVSRMPCTAHILQLVVGKGLLPAKVFVAHAKQLINFFISSKQNERLENVQQSLQIPEAN